MRLATLEKRITTNTMEKSWLMLLRDPTYDAEPIMYIQKQPILIIKKGVLLCV